MRVLFKRRQEELERFGEPLAVSTPVDSVWVSPKELLQAADRIPQLAETVKRELNGMKPEEYVIVDPDSRLLQLGMLPVVKGDPLFPRR